MKGTQRTRWRSFARESGVGNGRTIKAALRVGRGHSGEQSRPRGEVSSMSRPPQAPVRGLGHLGPKSKHRAGLNWPDAVWVRCTGAQLLWRALIRQRGEVPRQTKHGEWSLPQDNTRGGLGVTSGAPSRQHMRSSITGELGRRRL
jgi:hypothetical protein